MELTLNLVWVCVAIAGILVQVVMLSRTATSSERPVSHCRKIVAMVCSLVILFFVISMTDDLHDQEIVLEDSKSSRIASGTGASSHPSASRMIPIVFLPSVAAASLTSALPAVRRLVEAHELWFVAVIVCAPLCGRAPPSSLA